MEKLVLAVIYLQNIIRMFYKEYLKKLLVISLAINFTPLIAKSSVQLVIK